MIELALALILTQTPTVPPEVLQRFEAERGPVLQALSAKYACDKPAKTPKPLCAVAQIDEKGTAEDIRGKNTFVGLTWMVKRGKAGKAELSEPKVSALALNKDSVGVWGALTEIAPQNAEERKMLAGLAKDYTALLEGRKATVSLPADVRALLAVWSKSANQLVEKKDGAWVIKGGAIRKVGERWVVVGAPRGGEGIIVSIFVPYVEPQ
jgi:hypothetical protein